jgi:large subunit ribosomal protein L21
VPGGGCKSSGINAFGRSARSIIKKATSMYAVIQDRNRQYRAAAGDTLTLDLAEHEVGATIEMPVLLVADGATVKVGAPFVAGAKAVCKVVKHQAGEKITVGKFKRRKHMTNRRKGFRAQQTVVQVVSIDA